MRILFLIVLFFCFSVGQNNKVVLKKDNKINLVEKNNDDLYKKAEENDKEILRLAKEVASEKKVKPTIKIKYVYLKPKEKPRDTMSKIDTVYIPMVDRRNLIQRILNKKRNK
jgi:hypothetical protein